MIRKAWPKKKIGRAKQHTLSCLLKICQVPRPKVIAPGRNSNHFDHLDLFSCSNLKYPSTQKGQKPNYQPFWTKLLTKILNTKKKKKKEKKQTRSLRRGRQVRLRCRGNGRCWGAVEELPMAGKSATIATELGYGFNNGGRRCCHINGSNRSFSFHRLKNHNLRYSYISCTEN